MISYANYVKELGCGILLPLGTNAGLVDRSGGGHDGTAVGGATIGNISDGPLFQYDEGATSLDGVDDRISTDYKTLTNYFVNPYFYNNVTDGVYMAGSVATNLAPKPLTQSGAPILSVGYNATVTAIAGTGESGNGYLTRATLTAAATGGGYQNFSSTEYEAVTAGTQYTASVNLLAVPAGRTVQVSIYWKDSGGGGVGTNAYANATTTGRVAVTGTAPAGAVKAAVTIYILAGAIGESVDYDGLLFEQTSTAKPFFPTVNQISWGQITWTGTAHNSTSELRPKIDRATGVNGAVIGTAALRCLTGPRQGQGVNFVVASGMPGSKTYYAAVYLTALPGMGGRTVTLSFYSRNSGGTLSGVASDVILTETPQKFSLSHAFESNADRCWFIVGTPSSDTACHFYADAIKIGTDTTYFDGNSTQLGAGWTGTPHNSSSQIGPFANGASRTFMCWLMRKSTSSYDGIFGGEGGTDPLLYLGNGNQSLTFRIGNPATYVNLGTWPDVWHWHHLAVVMDEKNDTAECYIDGASQGSHAMTSPYTAESGRMNLSAEHNLDGRLCFASLHNRVLTDDEILTAYNLGIGEYWDPVDGLPILPSSADPVDHQTVAVLNNA